MKAALVHQPIVVTVDAASMDFMSYMSGVFNSSNCTTILNHNVLAVGWGYD